MVKRQNSITLQEMKRGFKCWRLKASVLKWYLPQALIIMIVMLQIREMHAMGLGLPDRVNYGK